MDIIQKINQLLEEKNISRNQLARKIGKNQSTLHYILAGKSKLDLDTFLKICEALEVSPCDLLGYTSKNILLTDTNIRMLAAYEYYKYMEIVPQLDENKYLLFEFWYLLLLNFFVNFDAEEKLLPEDVLFAFLKGQIEEALKLLKRPDLNPQEKKKLKNNIVFTYKVLKAAQNNDKEELDKYKQLMIVSIEKKIQKFNEALLMQMAFSEDLQDSFKKIVSFDDFSEEDFKEVGKILSDMVKEENANKTKKK